MIILVVIIFGTYVFVTVAWHVLLEEPSQVFQTFFLVLLEVTVHNDDRPVGEIASSTTILPKADVAVQITFTVSIRSTTGIKPLYTTIATVTMNLIVSAAIVLLNPYVTVYISYKIPPFALSVHIPDVSTSIYVEVDSKVLLGLPFCDKAFVR